MQPFDLADAGVGIGLIGMLLGVYLLYEKRQARKLDRIIAEKEAAMNAPEQRTATPQ
jgi:hypothetical protein